MNSFMNTKTNIPIIDFHAHILPHADHGCDSVETAVKQLALAKESGIDYVVATSHFYPSDVNIDTFLRIREKAYAKLSAESIQIPKVLLGAEVLFCDGMDKAEGIDKLTANDSGYLLLEMPFGSWKDRWFDTLEKLFDKMSGKIILAHVDRYEKGNIKSLLDAGFLGQLNAAAAGFFGIDKDYLKWVTSGKIVAVGSDIHGTTTGYKSYNKLRKQLGVDFYSIMKRTADILKIEY